MFDWRSLWRRKSKPLTALSSGSLKLFVLRCRSMDFWCNVFQFTLGSLWYLLVYLDIVDRRWAPKKCPKQPSAHLRAFGGAGWHSPTASEPEQVDGNVCSLDKPEPRPHWLTRYYNPKGSLPCGPVGLWNRFTHTHICIYYIHEWLQKGNSVLRSTPNAGQPWECGWQICHWKCGRLIRGFAFCWLFCGAYIIYTYILHILHYAYT